jgi:hypothetical protein
VQVEAGNGCSLIVRLRGGLQSLGNGIRRGICYGIADPVVGGWARLARCHAQSLQQLIFAIPSLCH